MNHYLNDIWDGFKISAGAAVGLILAVLKLSNGLERKIKNTAKEVVTMEIKLHHADCIETLPVKIRECIEQSARLATMEANIQHIKETLDNMNGI